jgi:hypothetical protein
MTFEVLGFLVLNKNLFIIKFSVAIPEQWVKDFDSDTFLSISIRNIRRYTVSCKLLPRTPHRRHRPQI